MAQIVRPIKQAMKIVDAEISGNSNGFYGRGLAGEGYAGGYRDALMDVLLLLRGVQPNRRNYWKAAAMLAERERTP